LSPSGWQFIHYNVEASPNPWTMYVWIWTIYLIASLILTLLKSSSLFSWAAPFWVEL
jgi:hypothetical protein